MNHIRKIYYYLLRKYFGSERLFYSIKARKDSYITIVDRPKFSKDFDRSSDKIPGIPKFAIVIQGKLVREDSFTRGTVELYKKTFPGCAIIFSSHEGTDAVEDLEAFRGLGVHVVLSPKPPNNGPFNINLQITSAQAGLKKAKQLGFLYAIKTRSDIRLYGVNIPEYLYGLMKMFPVKDNKQMERIISTNIYTLKYRPYSLSDMTVSGNIDDLIVYFSPPLDMRKEIKLKEKMTVEDFMKERPGELYLETEYLKSIGHVPLNTLEDSWRCFAQLFCVVDQQSLDSYWLKSSTYGHLENKFQNYGAEFGMQDLNFREWFNLYTRYETKNK